MQFNRNSDLVYNHNSNYIYDSAKSEYGGALQIIYLYLNNIIHCLVINGIVAMVCNYFLPPSLAPYFRFLAIITPMEHMQRAVVITRAIIPPTTPSIIL